MSNEKLIIYGCGGHARSLADVALTNGVAQLIFVDGNAQTDEQQFGFPVVTVAPEQSDFCIVAIGDNHQRAALFNTLLDKNVASLIAHNAHIGTDAKIARGVFVGQGAHIGPNAMIGANTIINTHAVVEHDCKIGKHCHISVNAVIAGRSQIDDYVMVGAGATVIDGVSVCADVVIGAGAVVVADIIEPGTYVGVPARRVDL